MGNITADFISATKKIHADVRAILTMLHVIRADMRAMSEQSVLSRNDQTKAQQTENSNSEPEEGFTVGSDVDNTNPTKNKKAETHDGKNGTLQNLKRNFWEDVAKPKTYVEFLALVFLVLYTCETKRTNDLTESSLKFTRDSISANIVFEDWELSAPIVPNKPIIVINHFKDVGHSPATYGLEAKMFHWTDMPKEIPILAPEPNAGLEPESPPSRETISDEVLATDEFIYGIPKASELTKNYATRRLEPPLPRPTVFVIGRLVYDSFGVRTEKQFCFYIARHDASIADLAPASKVDDRFMFVTCPRWNALTTRQIPEH